MAQSFDTLFRKEGPVKPFEFDHNVASVFDDMAKRSIPFYEEAQARIFGILSRLPQSPRHICDLGTSTGSLLFFLAEKFDAPEMQFSGYDNSPAMIERALEKQKTLCVKGQIQFFVADITQFDFSGADTMILNYVLQFVPPEKRLPVLKTWHDLLPPGGVLILSEKTKPSREPLAQIFSDCHDDYRLKNHYSHLEIAQKRKALENRLIPWSLSQNLELLRQAGFQEPEPFLIWHNFASIAAVKS